MITYDKLLQEADNEGINVKEFTFTSGIKGLYCDNCIAINSKIETQIEKSCILAEELGHHFTSSGNILNQNIISNRKQELKARAWAYNKKISLKGLANAFLINNGNRYHMAEYLGVTEEFLDEAVKYYKYKYGTITDIDDCLILFYPYLQVIKIL